MLTMPRVRDGDTYFLILLATTTAFAFGVSTEAVDILI